MLAAWLYPRGFDALIAVSATVAGHYARALGLEGVEVIHNPVDLAAIDRLGLRVQDTAKVPMHLLLPGRIVHEKGHADFLQALAILRDQGRQFSATLAGDGPLRDEVKAAIRRLGLSDWVDITGRLEHRRMLQTIAGADIVVVPSRFEGFGLAAVEAMALSRPVLATAVGGLTEIIEHGRSGVLVPPNDPVAMAHALASLEPDAPLRARLGAGGRRRVEQVFELPVIATQLRGIYERITGVTA